MRCSTACSHEVLTDTLRRATRAQMPVIARNRRWRRILALAHMCRYGILGQCRKSDSQGLLPSTEGWAPKSGSMVSEDRRPQSNGGHHRGDRSTPSIRMTNVSRPIGLNERECAFESPGGLVVSEHLHFAPRDSSHGRLVVNNARGQYGSLTK
jgi:hypothetical protein